jgi:transcriptional regulator with XRE-family HTH domain
MATQMKWNLRAFRDAKGLTQQQVADHLQVVRSLYTEYELGTKRLPAPRLYALSQLFEVSMEELLPCNEALPLTGGATP